jgi:excinuclease UvrABC nuclease subunit
LDALWLLGFEDADLDNPPPFSGIYALFSETGESTYLGQSVSIRVRLQEHRRSKKWFQDVTSLKVMKCEDAQRRLVLETLLILLYTPRANKAIKLGKNADGSWGERQFLRFSKARPKASGTK